MCIWLMNLKDKRSKEKCADKELKFRLCKEKGILAIGWGITAEVDSWQEYCLNAEKIYKDDKGFSNAVKALAAMKEGDLVWVKSPITSIWHLARITDKNPEPSICKNLKEFDICSYRMCEFLDANPSQGICDLLNSQKIVKRNTVSKITDEKLTNTTIAFAKEKRI